MPSRLIFFAGALFCLTPWASSPIALGLGLALALLGFAPYPKPSARIAKLLIQVCIVLLGFSMDLMQVARAGMTGVLFAAGTITSVFALGHLLGKWLGLEKKLETLLSAGTAICGGSAIAATGSVISATSSQMSVAIGAVFILNAIALYVFPPLGHALHLSQHQFGTWAAVAIHDVASVVGAAKEYGPIALEEATAVKLTRTLWIVPVALCAGWFVRRAEARALAATPAAPIDAAVQGTKPKPAFPVPWFIGLFVLAMLVRRAADAVAPSLSLSAEQITQGADALKWTAGKGMTLALFLIGSGLSREAIKSVGWRAMVQAVTLWVFISVVSLMVVRALPE